MGIPLRSKWKEEHKNTCEPSKIYFPFMWTLLQYSAHKVCGGIISPVFLKSYTVFLKLYTFIPVYDFTNTGIRFQDTGIRFQRHRYTISQTPEKQFFATFGNLKGEIKKIENMGGLIIPPRYGIKQIKIFKNPVSVSL